MEYKELLSNYREQINTLDKEVIYLLSRRFEIVKQIGLLKKENNIDVLQKGRWEELLKNNIEFGNNLLVSENLVKDIWERIHVESLNIEK